MTDRPPLVEVLLWQRQAWESGERPAVEEILERFLHLRDDDDAVLDLIYQETVLREAAGEKVSAGEYVARFPRLETPLRIQFEVEQALTLDRFPDASPATGLPRLEGCEIHGEIGRGAMGVVYRGWQVAACRPVAVKVVSADVPAGRVRAEAAAASRLLHPNIVQLFEVKEYEGRPALVMEYVEGGSLDEKLAGQPQPPPAAARLVETLAWAMAYAHGRGIVHRDLKPSNVLLSAGPGEPLRVCVPKVGDFGVAKFLEGGPPLTATNELLGTPSYMAPELTGGAAVADATADIYSLGAILYECLTGRPPFLGETPLGTLEQVRHQDPVPPSRLQPRLPRDLEIICLKCLRKSPARRYATARELAEDLSRFLGGDSIQARPAGRLERAWKWARRNPSAVALALVSLLAVTSLIAVGVALNQALRRQRDQAREHADETERQLGRTRRLLYTTQLLRVGSVWEGDPAQGLRMLEDRVASPPDLRCLSWAVLHGQCKRYRQAILGLGSTVKVVAHHPRGRLIITGEASGDVSLWDAETGQRTSRLAGHDRELTTLAVSGDGLLLATADASGTVRLWDMPGGLARGRLSVPGRVGGLAWHPDGKSLVVAAGQVTMWDARALRQRRTLRGGTHPQSGVAVSPNGQLIAAGGPDDTVRLWDARTGKPGGSMRGHAAPATSFAFTRDSARLVSGGLDGALLVWDVGRQTRIDHFDTAVGPVTALTLHPTEPVVAVAGSGDGAEVPIDVQLWDLSSRRAAEPLRGHGGASTVAFAPDGRSVITAGADRSVKLWDYPARREQVRLRGYAGGGALSRDGRLFVWVANEREVVLLDLKTGAERHTFRGQGRPVQAVALTPNGDHLAAAVGHPGEPAELLVWSTQSGRLVQAMSGHPGECAGLSFRPDGKQLAAGGRDGTVHLWDIASGKARLTLDSGSRTVRSLAWAGERIAAVGDSLTVWDARTGEELKRHRLPAEGRAVALTNPGDLAAVGVGEEVHLFDLAGDGRREPLPVTMKEIAFVSFSGDGQALAVAGSAGGVQLWDVATGQERASLSGHRGGAGFAGFADQGPLLVTVSRSRLARLWYGPRPW